MIYFAKIPSCIAMKYHLDNNMNCSKHVKQSSKWFMNLQYLIYHQTLWLSYFQQDRNTFKTIVMDNVCEMSFDVIKRLLWKGVTRYNVKTSSGSPSRFMLPLLVEMNGLEIYSDFHVDTNGRFKIIIHHLLPWKRTDCFCDLLFLPGQ